MKIKVVIGLFISFWMTSVAEILHFSADFQDLNAVGLTEPLINGSTAMGSWIVNNQQESSATNGVIRLDFGTYNYRAALNDDEVIDLSANTVFIEYKVRSCRGAASVGGKANAFRIFDGSYHQMFSVDYSTVSEQYGAVQLVTDNTILLTTNLMANVSGTATTPPEEFEHFVLILRETTFDVRVNGVTLISNASYTSGSDDSIRQFRLVGETSYSGAWYDDFKVYSEDSNTPIHFLADFEEASDGSVSVSNLNAGTLIGNWTVGSVEESYVSGGRVAFDQGTYSFTADFVSNAERSSGVTISYEVRSKRGAAGLYGKANELQVLDENGHQLIFLQYSTTADGVGGLQVWNASSSSWEELTTTLAGPSTTAEDLELIEIQMDGSGYTVWVNGMFASDVLPFNDTSGSQVGSLVFSGQNTWAGAWYDNISVLSGTEEALRGVYEEITKYLDDPIVNKYCFHNGNLMGHANTVQQSDSGEYMHYDFGTWNGSSWNGSHYYNATNLETLVSHPLTVVNGWGTTNFWESGWCCKNGKYAVYWSAWEGSPNGDPSSRIGVGIGTSPYGPFTNNATPLDLGAYSDIHSINPYPFVDPDTGQVYLYWAMKNPANYSLWGGQEGSCVYGVELNGNTLTNIIGSPILLTMPDLDWEKGGYGGADRRWNESPIVFKKEGLYYLLYSARCWNSRDYCTGYATSSSPLGPFTEYDGNPFAWGNPNFVNDVWGKVGMKTVISTVDNEEMWAVYHITNPKYLIGTPGEAQDLIGTEYNKMDPVVIRSDGTLAFNGPNIFYQTRPAGTMNGRNVMKGGLFWSSGTPAGFTLNSLRDGEIAMDACFSEYDWVSSQSATNTWINRGFISPKQVGVIMVYKSMELSRYFSQVTATIQTSTGSVISTNISIPGLKYAGAAGIASFNPELENVTNVCFSNFVLGPGATEVGISEIKIMGDNMSTAGSGLTVIIQ